MLAVSQIAFITHIDERIVEINKKQCADCRAMKLVDEIEEKKKNESELKLKQNYIKDIPKYLESIEKETGFWWKIR